MTFLSNKGRHKNSLATFEAGKKGVVALGNKLSQPKMRT